MLYGGLCSNHILFVTSGWASRTWRQVPVLVLWSVQVGATCPAPGLQLPCLLRGLFNLASNCSNDPCTHPTRPPSPRTVTINVPSSGSQLEATWPGLARADSHQSSRVFEYVCLRIAVSQKTPSLSVHSFCFSGSIPGNPRHFFSTAVVALAVDFD
jgi:hypothetical protein